MYTFESRVRFSEVDATEKLTLPAVVNYFQDCTTFQSEELGRGIEALKAIGKGWILSAWQIEVNRYPKICEKLKIDTWATTFDGIYGNRNFRLRTENDEVLARANSIWVYMDLVKGRPLRPDQDVISAYEIDPPLDMEPVSRKIALPKELEEREAFPVLRHQIDVNNHVNNCQYIQMALEVLPECGRAKKIRVEYKKSAVYGDKIVLKKAVEESRIVVELCDTENTPYAIVEFFSF